MPRKRDDLPKNVSVYKIRRRNGIKWRAQLGKRFTGSQRQTKDFDTLADAQQWIFGDAQKQKADSGLSLIQLKQQAGQEAFQLKSAQLSEAISAFKRLDGSGMTLTEAINFALKQSRPDAGVISMAEAIKLALSRKTKRSAVYQKNLGKVWRRFERWLPKEKKKAIHLITQLDIRKFLSEQKIEPKGESNLRKNLSPFFAWAVEFQYMTENPCSGIRTEDDGDKKPPVILSITGVRKLLETAQTEVVQTLRVGKDKYDDVRVFPNDLIPWITLGLFAGLRPDEARLLQWEDINFDKNRLVIRHPDGSRGRVVKNLEPILIEWLKPLRPESGKGKMNSNHRWKFKAFQKALGEGWSPWPQDALRHSYASYHLARDEHAGKTSFRMGHRNPNTTFQYYVDTVEEQSDVDAYWSLTPTEVKKLGELVVQQPTR